MAFNYDRRTFGFVLLITLGHLSQRTYKRLEIHKMDIGRLSPTCNRSSFVEMCIAHASYIFFSKVLVMEDFYRRRSLRSLPFASFISYSLHRHVLWLLPLPCTCPDQYSISYRSPHNWSRSSYSTHFTFDRDSAREEAAVTS